MSKVRVIEQLDNVPIGTKWRGLQGTKFGSFIDQQAAEVFITFGRNEDRNIHRSLTHATGYKTYILVNHFGWKDVEIVSTPGD